MAKTRTLKEYSSIALTASDVTQSTEIIEPLGDITGIDIDLSLTMVGTLVGAQPMTKAIKRLTITDKSGAPIIDVLGSDIDKLYQILNSKGHYVSVSNASTSATTYQATLNVPMKVANQPCKVQVVFAPYSDLATSGATGGTATLKLRFWYGAAPYTMRIYKRTLSVASGDNNLGIQLVDGKQTIAMAFTIGTESNINNITFSTDGRVDEYSKMPLQQLTDLEKQQLVSGHTTGLFNMFIDPFVCDISKTKLAVNSAGADTMNMYQVALN